MSDLFASTIAVFAVYCLYCISIYQPRPATIEPESQPINYFPEIDESIIDEAVFPTEDAIAVEDWESIAKYDDQFNGMTAEQVEEIIVERRPVAAFTVPKAPAVNYSTMSIRELKSECQKLTGTDRAVAKYSRLNRHQLIAALTR